MRLKRIITFVVLVCLLAVSGRVACAEEEWDVIEAETYVIQFMLNKDEGRWEYTIPEEERILWEHIYMNPFFEEYEAFNIREEDGKILLDEYSESRGAYPEPVWMYLSGICVYGDNAVYDSFRTVFGGQITSFYSIQCENFEVYSYYGRNPIRGAFEGQELYIFVEYGQNEAVRPYSDEVRMYMNYGTSGISYSFTMPAHDVTVHSSYRMYPITVVNGGAGYQFYEPITEAYPGEWIVIYPDYGPRDDGYYYTGKWESDDVTINDYKEGAATIIMPDHAVTISAELAKQEPVTVDLRTGSTQADSDVCVCLLQASGDERNNPFIDLNGDRIDDIIIDWNTYTIKTLEKYSCGESIELTGRTDWKYYPVTVLYDPELAKASADISPTPTAEPTPTTEPTATVAPTAEPGPTGGLTDSSNKPSETTDSGKDKEKKDQNDFNYLYIILPAAAALIATIAAWIVMKKKKAKKNGEK